MLTRTRMMMITAFAIVAAFAVATTALAISASVCN